MVGSHSSIQTYQNILVLAKLFGIETLQKKLAAVVQRMSKLCVKIDVDSVHDFSRSNFNVEISIGYGSEFFLDMSLLDIPNGHLYHARQNEIHISDLHHKK